MALFVVVVVVVFVVVSLLGVTCFWGCIFYYFVFVFKPLLRQSVSGGGEIGYCRPRLLSYKWGLFISPALFQHFTTQPPLEPA